MGRLQDKVTIITGGASGMGRVAARMFAAEGAKVVVADVTAPAAQSVVDEVKAAGGQAIAVVADVSKEADAKRMIDETIAAFGRVDVLYNDAGGRQRTLLGGLAPGTGTWLPTLPFLFLENALQVLSLDGLTTQVRFRFTPTNILLGSGKWRIDDVYVDPLKIW